MPRGSKGSTAALSQKAIVSRLFGHDVFQISLSVVLDTSATSVRAVQCRKTQKRTDMALGSAYRHADAVPCASLLIFESCSEENSPCESVARRISRTKLKPSICTCTHYYMFGHLQEHGKKKAGFQIAHTTARPGFLRFEVSCPRLAGWVFHGSSPEARRRRSLGSPWPPRASCSCGVVSPTGTSPRRAGGRPKLWRSSRSV